MPYLWAADTMISEGSSVINEYLGLGKCGIIVDLDDSGMRHHDGDPLLEEHPAEWLRESFVHIARGEDLLAASSLRVKQAIESLLAGRGAPA